MRKSNKYDRIAVPPEFKKLVRVESAKAGKKMVEWMSDMAEDYKDIKPFERIEPKNDGKKKPFFRL